jgi:hypothetical protein
MNGDYQNQRTRNSLAKRPEIQNVIGSRSKSEIERIRDHDDQVSLFLTNPPSLSQMTKPTVVIDVGTGYTKMGYSTNSRPDFIIPTLVGNKNLMGVSQAKLRGVEDLDFYIGFEAIQNQAAYPGTNVMKHGQIEDWDKVEQFWEQCIFKYLRCEPEDHPILLWRWAGKRTRAWL